MNQVLGNEGQLCTFCGREGTMTREHVVPAWLSERALEPLMSNVRTNQGEIAIWARPTVKDVCADCNNGPLARLDEYALELFEKYFERIVERGDLITFEYDFRLLCRWLLKVAYNTARARRWEFKPSRELLDFVIADGAINSQPQLVLQLLIPTKELPGVHPKIVPFDNRVGLLMPEGLGGLESGFLVSVRSYHFYVLIPSRVMIRRSKERAFEKIRKLLPGAVGLAGKRKVKIYSSFVDFASDAFRSPGLVQNLRLTPKR